MKKLLLSTVLISSLFANSEYQKWLDEESNSYQEYKKSLDEEFSSMLKKDWENFQESFTPNVYKKPKPKVLPKIKKEKKIKVSEIKKSKPVVLKVIKLPKKKEIIEESPVKIENEPIKIVDNKKEKTKALIKKVPVPKIDHLNKEVIIDYFGTSIPLYYKLQVKKRISRVSKSNISEYWNFLGKQDLSNLFSQINVLSKKHNLNDWGKYLLINKFASKLHPQDKVNTNLLTWFILTKLGYDLKIGYSNNSIYLLANIAHTVYQVSFFRIGNKKYYVLNPDRTKERVTKMYTYKGTYPKETKALSFAIDKPLLLENEELRNKKLKFNYSKKLYEIKTTYSKSLADFYATLPQSDYKIYFNAQSSKHFNSTLLPQLKKIIEGKSELEALNILLRFSQKAFKYKTDFNQFTYEKVMLPEETIFYPYSDCEDRSIMFRYLVENLTNIKVKGLQYSDHMATAVKLNSNISGDSFLIDGQRYTISDPTYINANIGMAMPKYKNVSFKVID